MKEWFLNNLGLKIAMLILAIPVWLILINISNPMQTKAIPNVEVVILNDNVITESDQTYTVTNNKTVTLQVTARKKDIADITAKDFYVYADMNYYFGQDKESKAAQIKIDIVGHNTIIDSDSVSIKGDDYLMFKLENVITREFPVNIVYSGTLPEDLSIGTATTNPEKIKITAAESKLASVNSVRVNVDLSGIDADTQTIPAAIKLYNANGKEITQLDGLDIERNRVEVNFEIMKTKVVPISFGDVTGTPAEGYRYSGLTSDITSVKLVGLKAALADISSLQIPSNCLDVSGATRDVTCEIDLNNYLPENVEVADENHVVTIVMSIEKLQEKTFKLKTSEIVMNHQNELYEYMFTNETVLVTVAGFQEDLDSITTEDIIAKLDVSDYGPGVYSMEVDVLVGSGFVVQGPVKVTVRIKEIAQETEESTEDSTEDSTENSSSSEESSSEPESDVPADATQQPSDEENQG